MKRRRESLEQQDGAERAAVDEDDEECVEVESVSTSRWPQRPTGNKAAKEEQHQTRVKEGTMRV